MEYRAIEHSLETIENKVKMICIRTHFSESTGLLKNEADLRKCFMDKGWQEVICLKNLTPLQFGDKVEPLIDGVQCWVNLKIRKPCIHDGLPAILFPI